MTKRRPVSLGALAQPASSTPRTLAEVQAMAAPEMRHVDQLIRARLTSDVVLINQVAEHIVGAGGKRLRPLSVILAARAAGYEGEAHWQAAAIVEFIHTATLLHDDVVDESDLRRGNRTANALWGNAASVLVGDFLYSRSFQLMVELDQMRIMQVLADTTNRIAEGEVLQLMHLNNPDTDEAAYFGVIERKTAVLFSAAARLGAILARLPKAEEQALAEFGMNLGLAFQIADDWLDYVGDADALGKNLGDDLAEGKATLPLIRTLATADPASAAHMREALTHGTLVALPEITRAIQQSGALDYCRERAGEFAARAHAALGTLPESPWRAALGVVAEYAVARDR
jgi:octaprenyl-diphosphate synthase